MKEIIITMLEVDHVHSLPTHHTFTDACQNKMTLKFDLLPLKLNLVTYLKVNDVLK